jgi:hypothetical protein
MATDTSSTYGSLSDYFSQSGGTKSQGKSGGGGGSAQQYATQSGGSDNTSGGQATSGSGWISAAVSQTSSDKSQFTTPFSQQFGGITNNQIVDSPYATGATNASPIAPITGTSDPTGATAGIGGINPITLLLVVFAGVAAILYVRR